jgi:S-adenosylmethionine/arginine decarboxylase-like enzyme
MTDVLHDPAAGHVLVDNPDEPFGWHLAMDLFDCNLDTMTSAAALAWYVESLCDRVLHMKRYGPTLTEDFGWAHPKTSGFTVYQMIETSDVRGHLSTGRRTAHFDVFSCAWYDPDEVLVFTCDFFDARLRTQRFDERR